MIDPILTLHPQDLSGSMDLATHLEEGQVIYCPHQPFALSDAEQLLFTDTLLDGSHKNISYHAVQQQLNGVKNTPPSTQALLKSFMHRYAEYTTNWVNTLFPHYKPHLEQGRTSYRPAEIKGRTSSKRKDDTRIHVDAFPSTPLQGKRILRVFNNIHPQNVPRIWNLGEPFGEVMRQFQPTVPTYRPWLASLLYLLRMTKAKHSKYDHMMLHIHDNMKQDDIYQKTAPKTQFIFPPHSLWFVFTDLVSHAALSGQFVLEQTFYLPVDAMKHPELSPLHRLHGGVPIIKR